MFDTIFGLPLHPLVVHATVVALPAAAVAVLAAALWPRFRRWAGLLPVLLAAVGLILVPVSTESGESLEKRLGASPLVEQHQAIARGLLPWAALLFVAGVLVTVVWWFDRRAVTVAADRPRAARDRGAAMPLVVAAVLVAAVAAVGTGVQVVRTGHTGAQAAWSGVMQ